ncbi:MAG: ABC transporter substrate-binding protein [Gammaproteobacteria bacterium]|nr:ABC transporter substrate-binding protein [Gammaproteobacteria bacterium]
MFNSLRQVGVVGLSLVVTVLTACGEQPWNSPYPDSELGQNILYSSFEARPKHLDPIRSYSSNEYAFIGQIYEPPLQYHYLKRPYELVPLTATQVPEPEIFDKNGKRLAKNTPANQVHRSVYTIEIQKGIQYQPHPAFARDEQGNPRYLGLAEEQIKQYHTLSEFIQTGSRELTADDYVYQMKRLAHPALHSPIYGVMAAYFVGLDDYAKRLKTEYEELKKRGELFLDLRKYDLPAVKVLDRYRYQITIEGSYPQLVYWLSMPFFAPMPVEADQFYSQKGMKDNNITLDWYPVGTGAYMLTVNNPNRQMIMVKNPNYRGDRYPTEGERGDRELGLLADAGKPMPFIDKVVYSLEKETIPYWNKFLQGYYDTSGISSESFDQAIQVSGQGEVGLSEQMKEKGIRLSTSVATSTFYLGFNMIDPVIGGLSERARKLRQSLSIAIDYEEYISIFMNGRGIPAQGPLPPGIFGYVEGEKGINPVVYDWEDGRAKRKPITAAQKLLAEAGYPNGVDSKSGKPLVLNLDIAGGGPDDKARFNWFRKQFDKLNIQLVVRNTQYNRFQEKMLKGSAQIYIWGWNADYPDPENFLFLLYGPNQKVDKNGENASNYKNKKFDALFERMKNMPNGVDRQAIIDQMVNIAREDAPWIWGVNPKNYGLYHDWFLNAKPNLMSHNTMQYKRINGPLREQKRNEWNQPVLLPVLLIFVFMIIIIVPAIMSYKKREQLSPAKVHS